MHEVQIREALISELEGCAQVIRRGFATVAEDFGLTAENCATNGAFIQADRLIADKRKGNFMYVLTVNNEIAGFMQLEKKSDEQYELEKITVLPAFRHHGYGKTLLDYAKDKAKKFGAKRLTIGIIEENAVLKDWYSQNGFKHTGTRQFTFLPFTVGFMEYAIG